MDGAVNIAASLYGCYTDHRSWHWMLLGFRRDFAGTDGRHLLRHSADATAQEERSCTHLRRVPVPGCRISCDFCRSPARPATRLVALRRVHRLVLVRSYDTTKNRWLLTSSRTLRRFGKHLELELSVTRGTSPFCFEEPLHRYFKAGPIEKRRMREPHGVTYLDDKDTTNRRCGCSA